MTDYISRADAIDAVAQQWLFEASVGNPYVNDDDIGEYRKLAEELFEDIPSVELPKGDLISRAEVLSLFPNAFYDGLASQIKALPSADAVQGEWIEYTDREGKTRTITCSECGWEEHSWIDTNYCPNCGARMKGGAE